MLLSLLGNSSFTLGEKIVYILVMLFCVLLSLSVHEMSHGLAAYAMGDKTAENSGRLSINPFHHLDPFGALCLFLFGFGWAKPVPINPWNFKHKKGGTAVTALAGPVSNFILAFIAEIFVVVLGRMSFTSASFAFNVASVCYILASYLVTVNLGLGLFNLIPIPPLDGSKIINAILPQRIWFKIMQYERYGFLILIVLINLPGFNTFLYFYRQGVQNFFDMIITLFL